MSETKVLSPEEFDRRAAKMKEILELKKQEAMEALKWKVGYELSEVGAHNFAYKSKAEPVHHICPNCHDKNFKSVLRLAPNPPSRLRCDRCGISIFITTHAEDEINQLRSHMAVQAWQLDELKAKKSQTT